MDRPERSEQEQIQFFYQCIQKFKAAASVKPEIKYFYKIAETTVCLNFAGNALLPWLTPALEHLKTSATTPDLTIHVFDTLSTGINAPPPPCEWADFTDRGDIWGFNSKRIKTAFHWSEYSVNVLDLETNTGVYWVKNPKAFPYWVYSSPFRSMIQWWMEKNGGQLLHAAAVGTDKGAVLITGKGGSGKSTSAIVSLDQGMKYLGDDYVIVKKDPCPTVYSLYSTAKLNVEDMVKFPALSSLAAEKVKEDQEKEVMFLYPKLKNQIVEKLPLKAILTPKIQQKANTDIVPASFWPIQKAMSFTTMSQLPGVGSHTQQYIREFISQLSCYTLKPGSRFPDISNAIKDFIDHPEKYQQKSSEHSDKKKPLISIIIPVYNGAHFIGATIKNIMLQNYPATEIFIVDDGSTDHTREVVENLDEDVRYFYQPNSGPAAARNRAIRDVSGEFIAFLDVDDLWPENNLKMLMQELQQNPGLDLVRGYAQLFRMNEINEKEYIGNPKESYPNYIGAALYRKSVFEKVGLYDPELRFGEDGDWFNRAVEKNINMKRLDDVTLLVQRHENNMTKGKSMVELNALKVFKKKLERKRSAQSNTEPTKTAYSTSNKPLVSVIIPVYNGGAFVADAIESVKSQNYRPLEIIVVDDGSTDNTADMVKMSGDDVKYFRQKNQGPAAAKNAGLKMATAKFIAFLDADDIWVENKLIRQEELLRNHTKSDAVTGYTHKMPMSQNPAHIMENQGAFLLSPGATLFRKSVFEKVGVFDESLKSGEDIDWFLRAREAGIHIMIHQQLVLLYRTHGRNISNNQKLVNLYLLKIHKKSLDRRRKAGKGTAFKLPKLNDVDEVMNFWQNQE